MNFIKNFISIFLLIPLVLVSCDNGLTEINENPNGIVPGESHPNLLISTVMTGLATSTTSRGYAGDTGVGAQYTQRDSWSDNKYDWGTGTIWSTNYNLLRTNKLANDRAVELGLEFHEGVTLVLKSMLFGALTDYYGDIPYTEATLGNVEGGTSRPKYDTQQAVYAGIITDLERASTLLSGTIFTDIDPDQDVFYHGDPEKWERLTNSLLLRYYMRLSEKDPSTAQDGVVATLAKPLIVSTDDDCVLAYVGGTENQSWPNSGQFGTASDFYRVKPCSTLTDKLDELSDPRMNIWFAPVEIPTKVVPAAQVPGGGDIGELDGVRYINEATIGVDYAIYSASTYAADLEAGLKLVDTNPVYVGLPVAVSSIDPFEYNLNFEGARGGKNPYVSKMNDIFNQKEDGGEFLKARLMSAAEVHFLMAEAAQRNWGSDTQGHYERGIQASLDAWGMGDEYTDYIDNVGVAFDGSLAQIMEQKWIANMFNGDQAYLDWRRTGLPAFVAGPFAREDVMPLRFIYPSDEININGDNYNIGASTLVETSYSTTDPNDSPYARPWIVQELSSPW